MLKSENSFIIKRIIPKNIEITYFYSDPILDSAEIDMHDKSKSND